MKLSVTYTVVDGEVLSEERNGVKRDFVGTPPSSAVVIARERRPTSPVSATGGIPAPSIVGMAQAQAVGALRTVARAAQPEVPGLRLISGEGPKGGS